MIDLGRNDLCHCGSGKKYKKCHLEADQRTRVRVRQSPQSSESPSACATLNDLPRLLRQLSRQGSARDRKEFSELLAEEPIFEYLERQTEIEAAGIELEKHRSHFRELLADNDRYLALAQSVFAEECFVPLRFTASDVQHAFDQVGYPATLAPDERMVEI